MYALMAILERSKAIVTFILNLGLIYLSFYCGRWALVGFKTRKLFVVFLLIIPIFEGIYPPRGLIFCMFGLFLPFFLKIQR
jgi:hypothetical protein